jgi:transketolase
VHTVKPIDRELVTELVASVRLIVTLEEHSVIGGLGGAVAEIVAQMSGAKADLEMIGLRDYFSSVVGDQEYLRSVYGLTADDVVSRVGVRLGS